MLLLGVSLAVSTACFRYKTYLRVYYIVTCMLRFFWTLPMIQCSSWIKKNHSWLKQPLLACCKRVWSVFPVSHSQVIYPLNDFLPCKLYLLQSKSTHYTGKTDQAFQNADCNVRHVLKPKELWRYVWKDKCRLQLIAALCWFFCSIGITINTLLDVSKVY